jgi:hypothetical protein
MSPKDEGSYWGYEQHRNWQLQNVQGFYNFLSTETKYKLKCLNKAFKGPRKHFITKRLKNDFAQTKVDPSPFNYLANCSQNTSDLHQRLMTAGRQTFPLATWRSTDHSIFLWRQGTYMLFLWITLLCWKPGVSSVLLICCRSMLLMLTDHQICVCQGWIKSKLS